MTHTTAGAKDITGQKFHFLTAVSFVGHVGPKKQAKWLFKCDCGQMTEKRAYNVIRGSTKSCGCWGVKSRYRHGHYYTPTYKCYYEMLRRCYSPNYKTFKNYGGRGVIVCDRWREGYENFLADMGERPDDKLSLDRINPFGNYEPENCRWADATIQANNQRRHWISRGLSDSEGRELS